MRINRKKSLIAGIVVLATVTGSVIYKFIEHNRAIAVFNDSSADYNVILEAGLPDGGSSEGDIQNFINSIFGFDIQEPQTVINSSSVIFEAVRDTPSEAVAQTSPPDISDSSEENVLPSFSQICNSTGISVNNATSYAVDANGICSEPLYIKPTNDGPQVLLVHTHTTECYDGDNQVGESDRTIDETKNMIEIGKEMKAVLEGYGIECIHDTTVHDYPTYQGAYTRQLATIQNNLEKYPSIKLVLDIHRDAFIYSDGSKLKVDCDINGESTAKVMIVCGTDAMGLMHPDWRENFKLATKIQNAAQIMYPGMMRPINLRRERFNMHLTTGSLIIEVGANGNTLEQARSSAQKTAIAIAAVLINQE